MIESVNLLAGASGNVLLSEIVGAIKMRVMIQNSSIKFDMSQESKMELKMKMPQSQVYLSGMPELRLGLNDKVLHATEPFLNS